MKNMLGVVEDYLNKQKNGATFEEIFTYVKEEMKQTWKELFPTKLLKTIEENKIGELYTLMTIDGRFVRDSNHRWFTIDKLPYDQVKQMRINISENEELVEEE